jgi:hypothetical protein
MLVQDWGQVGLMSIAVTHVQTVIKWELFEKIEPDRFKVLLNVQSVQVPSLVCPWRTSLLALHFACLQLCTSGFGAAVTQSIIGIWADLFHALSVCAKEEELRQQATLSFLVAAVLHADAMRVSSWLYNLPVEMGHSEGDEDSRPVQR